LGLRRAFDVSAIMAAAEQKIEFGEDDVKVVQVEGQQHRQSYPGF
jgi:hypothetical protein